MSEPLAEAPMSGPPAPPIVTRLGALAFVLALGVVALDQLSKLWILHGVELPQAGSIEVLPFFHLTMVWNAGVSFGLLRADPDTTRWALAAFQAVVAAGLAVWARKADRRLLALALGLVIGGAVGNLIDRVRYGAVVDFLDFKEIHFPWVFNVADSAITIGVALLILESLLQPKRIAA
jgi:signal peptidase II